jgi:hypothetical protein
LNDESELDSEQEGVSSKMQADALKKKSHKVDKSHKKYVKKHEGVRGAAKAFEANREDVKAEAQLVSTIKQKRRKYRVSTTASSCNKKHRLMKIETESRAFSVYAPKLWNTLPKIV